MFGPVLGDRPGFVGIGARRYQLLVQRFVLFVYPAPPGRVLPALVNSPEASLL